MHIGRCVSRCSNLKMCIKIKWILLVAFSTQCNLYADNEPWSLDKALATPEWISVSGSHRVRYETLDEQFRAGGNGDDQILVFRTNILALVTWKQWDFAFEILDSRQALGDDSTTISSGDVNNTHFAIAVHMGTRHRHFEF